MSVALDSSVLVAALDSTAPFHAECYALLDRSDLCIFTHALTETFSTLTGGKLGFRLAPREAAALLRGGIVPLLRTVSLSADAILQSVEEAESRGVRGGAIHDYLHLVAARQAEAVRLYTLNFSHFFAFYRHGEPVITHP